MRATAVRITGAALLALVMVLTGCASAGSSTGGDGANPTGGETSQPAAPSVDTSGSAPGSPSPFSVPLPSSESSASSAGTSLNSEPMSDTVLPTLPPQTPGPQDPSDTSAGTWEIGTVTRGGDGPCYALRTDDGRELAMWSLLAGELQQDTRIRVRVTASPGNQGCGAGTAVDILEVKNAG